MVLNKHLDYICDLVPTENHPVTSEWLRILIEDEPAQSTLSFPE